MGELVDRNPVGRAVLETLDQVAPDPPDECPRSVELSAAWTGSADRPEHGPDAVNFREQSSHVPLLVLRGSVSFLRASCRTGAVHAATSMPCVEVIEDA